MGIYLTPKNSYAAPGLPMGKINDLEIRVKALENGGGGSGVTVSTPTGAVDGANTSYTVTSAPKWIVSDGIIYFENNGYTLSGLTVTMSTPPTLYIRAIL